MGKLRKIVHKIIPIQPIRTVAPLSIPLGGGWAEERRRDIVGGGDQRSGGSAQLTGQGDYNPAVIQEKQNEADQLLTLGSIQNHQDAPLIDDSNIAPSDQRGFATLRLGNSKYTRQFKAGQFTGLQLPLSLPAPV